MEGSESHMISGYQQGESALSSSKGMERALRILRDSFMGRIPKKIGLLLSVWLGKNFGVRLQSTSERTNLNS